MKLPKYNNADICKDQILSDNKNKSGIYMWTNLINDKRYVGSSENLKIRFSQYFNVNHLNRSNYMYICRALLKHDYSNFKLEILEYCEPEKCLEKEDYYLKKLKPEYNISLNPSAPFSGRQHSDESKTIMSDAKSGENHPNYGKTLDNKTKQKISESKKGKPKIEGSGSPSQQIEVFDIKNNTTTYYDSIREAAKALNCDNSAIRYYFKSIKSKPYKGRYTFTKTK